MLCCNERERALARGNDAADFSMNYDRFFVHGSFRMPGGWLRIVIGEYELGLRAFDILDMNFFIFRQKEIDTINRKFLELEVYNEMVTHFVGG